MKAFTLEHIKLFKTWQTRVLFGIILGYAAFYLLRQNFSVTMLALQQEFAFSKTHLGWILSAHALIYGFGKGIWGAFSDRSNARYFMVLGLVFAAFSNILMSFGNSLWYFIVLWSLNACFLSMGAPPCIRLLTRWFSQKELATKWAVWNSSHQIGAASAVVLASFLMLHFGWRAAFWGPAILCLVLAGVLFFLLCDDPKSVGLPSVEEINGFPAQDTKDSENETSMKEILWDYVLKNPAVWMISLANLFYYVIRMGVLNWAPTFLAEVKGYNMQTSGSLTAVFDITGIFGGILAGWICDRWFSTRRSYVISGFVLLLGASILGVWHMPAGHPLISSFYMMLLGLFVSGPQILIGVSAADFASKKAAGAANGMTGTFGYIGASLSGVGVGVLVESYGWSFAMSLFVGCSVLCAILSLLALKLATNKQKTHQTLQELEDKTQVA